MTGSQEPSFEAIWPPVADADDARRASMERAFRACAATVERGDGEVGVFATRPIRAGTSLIYRWHDDYYRGMVGWEALSIEQVEQLPPHTHALFRRYGLEHDFGRMFGPMSPSHITTLDNFINHACDPNLGYDEDGNVIALRAIAPGDELRLDYGGFVVHYDEPFVCQCGAACCRTRVTRQDWRALAAAGGRQLAPFVMRRVRATGAAGAVASGRF